MCFSKAPKMPKIEAPPVQPAAPPAPPAPTILPEEVSAQGTDQERRKKLQRIRFGLASTIKTPLGVAGSENADLTASGAGKKTLG